MHTLSILTVAPFHFLCGKAASPKNNYITHEHSP